MNYTLKRLLLFPVDVLYSISPRLALKLLFRLKVGYSLNLKEPKSYNEKINWIKLNIKDPAFQLCSDKFHVRKFVEDMGYGYILNDILWEGFSPELIPFDALPDSFVIKATHGSGFNIICHDKSKLDRKKTVRVLKKWLKYKYLKCYGEWWYGLERPRIIIEKLLRNKDKTPLFDYKFFCFHGEPQYVYVDTWKNGNHHINMYDAEMNRLDGISMGYPTDETSMIHTPEALDRMKDVARDLSKNFLHVRVDLYLIDQERIVFGEMTFSKGAGLDKIKPQSFDYEMGEHLQLPTFTPEAYL